MPEEVPGADRGAPPFGPSWPEVLNGRPGAEDVYKRQVSDIDKMKVEEQKKAARSGYDMDILPPDLVTYSNEDVYKRQG